MESIGRYLFEKDEAIWENLNGLETHTTSKQEQTRQSEGYRAIWNSAQAILGLSAVIGLIQEDKEHLERFQCPLPLIYLGRLVEKFASDLGF